MPQPVFVIGTLPFLLILGAFIVTGVFFFVVQLTPADITEILLAMGTIWLVVILVLVFVSNVCMSISPVERFTDISGQETIVQEFFDAFNKAETTVCSLIADTVTFIKNDVGKKGQDDPSANEDAINDAVSNVDGPITVCPAAGTPTSVDDVDDRLSRMKRTLDQFIETEFKKTYDKAMKCDSESFIGHIVEPFDDAQDKFADFVSRLQDIQTKIGFLTSQYLNPIQQKQKDLKSGKASDCDKQKGAKSSVSSSLGQIQGGGKGI